WSPGTVPGPDVRHTPRNSFRERRGHAELEPVEILEVEHPHAPRAIGRLIEERPCPGSLDPCRGRVDVARALHVELEVEALPLDPVPAELAVILIEDDANVARDDGGAGHLPVTLERLRHREA